MITISRCSGMKEYQIRKSTYKMEECLVTKENGAFTIFNRSYLAQKVS